MANVLVDILYTTYGSIKKAKLDIFGYVQSSQLSTSPDIRIFCILSDFKITMHTLFFSSGMNESEGLNTQRRPPAL